MKQTKTFAYKLAIKNYTDELVQYCKEIGYEQLPNEEIGSYSILVNNANGENGKIKTFYILIENYERIVLDYSTQPNLTKALLAQCENSDTIFKGEWIFNHSGCSKFPLDEQPNRNVFPRATYEQLVKHFSNEGKQVEPKTERKIVGYKIKEKKYVRCICILLDYSYPNLIEDVEQLGYEIAFNSKGAKELEKLRLLELWCNPVYSEPTLEDRIKSVFEKHDITYVLNPNMNLITDLANLLKTEKND